jgi:hypothetical protein
MCGKCAAREAEQENPVARLIVLGQKNVSKADHVSHACSVRRGEGVGNMRSLCTNTTEMTTCARQTRMIQVCGGREAADLVGGRCGRMTG